MFGEKPIIMPALTILGWRRDWPAAASPSEQFMPNRLELVQSTVAPIAWISAAPG
jgi:hypothetical protein